MDFVFDIPINVSYCLLAIGGNYASTVRIQNCNITAKFTSHIREISQSLGEQQWLDQLCSIIEAIVLILLSYCIEFVGLSAILPILFDLCARPFSEWTADQFSALRSSVHFGIVRNEGVLESNH